MERRFNRLIRNIEPYTEKIIYPKFIMYLSAVVFFTNLTQLPFIVNLGYSSVLSMLPWISLCLFFIFLPRIQITYSFLRFLLLGVLFACGLYFFELITQQNYIRSVLSIPVYQSIFIYVIGYFFSNIITNKKAMDYILLAYVLSAVIVAVNVYSTYFYNGFQWESVDYVYQSKNSISQILFTSVAILLLYFKNQSFCYRLLKWGATFFLTILILALKSRATIICYVIIVYAMMFKSKKYKKHRIMLLTCFLMGSSIFIIMFNSDYYFFYNILLAGRDPSSLNAISSGRMDILTEAFDLWRNNELLGIGSKYIECFYAAAIVQYGIILGALLIFIALQPIFEPYKKIYGMDFNIMYKVIAITYIVNGIFECLAPFGPGVKCYLLWFLFGIISSQHKKINSRKANNYFYDRGETF